MANIEYFGIVFAEGYLDEMFDDEHYWEVEKLFPWFKNQINLEKATSNRFYLTVNSRTGEFKLEQWEGPDSELSFSCKGKIKFQEPTIKQLS